MNFRLRKPLQIEPWQRSLAILFFAQLITAVGFSSIFPFLPLYIEQLGSNFAWSTEFLAGLVFSAQAFAMMIASPIWGALADRYGRKIMVERAMFCGAIILFLMGFVKTAEQLVLLRAIQGLLTGTVAAANALIASFTPRDRTGFAMGTLQMGLGTGIALGPVLGGILADSFGYRASFYVTGGLLFIAGVVVFIGVQEDFTPAAHPKLRFEHFIGEWKDVFRSPGVSAAYSLRFLTSLGRMMIVPYAPLFVAQLMANNPHLNTFTGLIVGVNSATATLSAIYLGRLGDRRGHRGILVLSTLAAAILFFPQSMVSTGWQLMGMQALVGFALGGMIPAISALLAHFTHSGQEGAVFGLDTSVNSGGRTIAPLLGSVIVLQYGLRAIFISTGILFLLSAGLAMLFLPQNEVPHAESNPLDGLDPTHNH